MFIKKAYSLFVDNLLIRGLKSYFSNLTDNYIRRAYISYPNDDSPAEFLERLLKRVKKQIKIVSLFALPTVLFAIIVPIVLLRLNLPLGKNGIKLFTIDLILLVVFLVWILFLSKMEETVKERLRQSTEE